MDSQPKNNDKEASSPNDDLVEVETKAEIITFYNHSSDPVKDKPRWSEFQDPVIEEKRLKKIGESFAIIHRQSKVEKDDMVSWITTSIEAQSPRLRKVLDLVFSDYPSWYPDGTPYAVAPPFKPYVHRWDALQEITKRTGDEKTAEELQLLVRELAPRVAGHLTALSKANETGTITFEDLWLILAPGCRMLSKKAGSLQVSKLVEALYIPAIPQKQPAHYVLTLASVDWNGAHCGLKVDVETIMDYSDAISITKLVAYPVEFAEDWDLKKEKLLARGRKFESLQGFHTKTCSGKKFMLEMDPFRGCMKEVERPVAGKIVVDAYAYYDVQDQIAPEIFPLSKIRESPTSFSKLLSKKAGKKNHRSGRVNPPRRRYHVNSDESDIENATYSESSSEVDDEFSGRLPPGGPPPPPMPHGFPPPLPFDMIMVSPPKGSKAEKEDKKGRKEQIIPLTDDECILAVPRVKGFDLVGKTWCEFNVDDVEEVKWDYSPYDNLVLPEGEKDLVLAFADRPQQKKQGFDDFVSDKGKGIIILLCGPPGVGKTLTAEAVAQKSCVPLYSLSASELGTAPRDVELALMKALKCCQLWNAVLLIDEADIYLEKRDSRSLGRNELVAIFLNRLEYYQGLMFLTTNRVASMDAAFRSRIDLILPYSDLEEPARRKVWVNFIEKLGPEVASVGEADFDKLAKTPLNGREIKNSIKTALVLANRDMPLRLKHLDIVLNIRKRVDNLK